MKRTPTGPPWMPCAANSTSLHIRGRVVIGEGERDEAPMLYIGEEVGTGDGPEVDIALDPLEGTTLCAKAMPNALAVMAIAEGGTLLNAPDIYMDKIAIGPGYPRAGRSRRRPGENIEALAKAKGVSLSDITVCMLDRPRHAELIDDVRTAGAAIPDRRRRRRRRDQTVEPPNRHRHVYRHRRRARRRAGGGGAAMRRRPDAGRLTALARTSASVPIAMGILDLSPKYSVELNGDRRRHVRRDRRHRRLAARRRDNSAWPR